MKRKLIGAWGEAAAADFLRQRGYKILSMGYRTRLGEIDLIAANRRYIAFVEVKTRRNDNFSMAREAVDRHKIIRIKQTAELYLAENSTGLQPRFDVIEIYAPQGTATVQPQINHLEDAFQ